MLTLNNISKSYGIETVLKDIRFTVNPGERVGLVGPNGSGKSTLLRIIAGCEIPDSGTVVFNPSDLRMGYLPQGMVAVEGQNLGSYLAGGNGDLVDLNQSLEELAGKIAGKPYDSGLQEEYDRVLAALQDTINQMVGISRFLKATGLEQFPLDTTVSTLSGGQKTRLALARLLASQPQLLLLDEPTNHLDIAMLEWLEDWLLNFRGGVLVVSHDRAILDTICTGIVELNPVTHNARSFAGGYSDYLVQKQGELEKMHQDYSDQQEEIARLRRAAAHMRGLAIFRKGGKADAGDKFARGFFGDRSRGTIGRARNIETRLNTLLNEERLQKPRQSWQMRVDFGGIPESGKIVLSLEDLSVGYGNNILLQAVNLTLIYKWRVVLVGENGCGKTSLLRTITGEIPALNGNFRLGSNVRPGYMAQEQEDLNPALTVMQTAAQYRSQSDTDVRAFLHKFLFSGDDVFVPVGSLSYGERARLSLACLVARGCNLLLLDEPINHLDIPSRVRFEQALRSFDGSILAVVHDRYFISGFATHLWEIVEGTIRSREF